MANVTGVPGGFVARLARQFGAQQNGTVDTVARTVDRVWDVTSDVSNYLTGTVSAGWSVFGLTPTNSGNNSRQHSRNNSFEPIPTTAFVEFAANDPRSPSTEPLIVGDSSNSQQQVHGMTPFERQFVEATQDGSAQLKIEEAVIVKFVDAPDEGPGETGPYLQTGNTLLTGVVAPTEASNPESAQDLNGEDRLTKTQKKLYKIADELRETEITSQLAIEPSLDLLDDVLRLVDEKKITNAKQFSKVFKTLTDQRQLANFGNKQYMISAAIETLVYKGQITTGLSFDKIVNQFKEMAKSLRQYLNVSKVLSSRLSEKLGVAKIGSKLDATKAAEVFESVSGELNLLCAITQSLHRNTLAYEMLRGMAIITTQRFPRYDLLAKEISDKGKRAAGLTGSSVKKLNSRFDASVEQCQNLAAKINESTRGAETVIRLAQRTSVFKFERTKAVAKDMMSKRLRPGTRDFYTAMLLQLMDKKVVGVAEIPISNDVDEYLKSSDSQLMDSQVGLAKRLQAEMSTTQDYDEIQSYIWDEKRVGRLDWLIEEAINQADKGRDFDKSFFGNLKQIIDVKKADYEKSGKKAEALKAVLQLEKLIQPILEDLGLDGDSASDAGLPNLDRMQTGVSDYDPLEKESSPSCWSRLISRFTNGGLSQWGVTPVESPKRMNTLPPSFWNSDQNNPAESDVAHLRATSFPVTKSAKDSVQKTLGQRLRSFFGLGGGNKTSENPQDRKSELIRKFYSRAGVSSNGLTKVMGTISGYNNVSDSVQQIPSIRTFEDPTDYAQWVTATGGVFGK